MTESAAWHEVAFLWFLLQMNCEHWRCVNRRLFFCRGVVARLSSCKGDVKCWTELDPKFVSSEFFVGIFVVCLSPLRSVERIHICTYLCHARVHSFAYDCHLHSLWWVRLHHTKAVCHISLIVVALVLTDLEGTRRFGILLFHTSSGAEILGDVRCN